MYFEERLVDGCLCFRTDPNGKWIQIPASELSKRLVAAMKTIERLEMEQEYQYEPIGY